MMEQMSRVGSSLRSHISIQIDNDDAESVSEAGDIGDRALPSRRYSERSSFSLSFDHRSENGAVVRPLPPELSSPLPTNALVGSGDTKHERGKGLPALLDYASCLLHLSVFGILGVGSFLMGWFGVVFKADISHVSEHLAIAITTGYLGSLTTFSGWNQKMVDLSVSGYWLFSALRFLIGLFLVAFSIIFGVETAKGFRWLLNRMNKRAGSDSFKINWKMDNYSRQLAVMVVLLVVLGLLWGVSAALVKSEFKHGGSYAQLWFSCMVGPLGVWIRWFLARFNGRGLGRTGLLKWIPFGTLAANISAASVMATLASVNKAVSF
ncbi:membrane protein [Spatholobus suberectus]|nr:membrane protein [Spatholobus suberectus]